MNIISYNINGIRAGLRKGFAEWLQAQNADVVCLQETKAHIADIPTEIFTEMGYHCYWHSAHKKGYSGVGILTRQAATKLQIGCGIPAYDHEGRVLLAQVGQVAVMSVYMPSGSSGDERQAFKMQFLSDFYPFLLRTLQQYPQLVVAGDYNICHQAIDIHDPVRNAQVSGFLPDERRWMDGLFAAEALFTDSFRYCHPNQAHQYSWWSFRANARQNNKGWRIDYQAVSQALTPHIAAADLLPDVAFADHCPTRLQLQF